MAKITVLHYAFGENGRKVAVVTPKSDSIIGGLEEAFEKTNTIRQPWYKATDIEVAYDAKSGCRSTSVGDVLMYDDRFFRVSPIGFKEFQV